MKFYWDPKEQSTKRHPVNIRFTKKTSKRYKCVRIETKNLYPWFNAVINHGYSFWC